MIAPGQRLGPYEILSPIGAGGMGEVYKARDERLERTVAVKILPADLALSAQLKLRFEREAKTISQLNHPHICSLYDIRTDSGLDYLVMELLEGESLAERLARGPMPVSDVLRYGAQIADALDRAHRAGVVHRDLKPANVMLTRSGAKLLDFGLAKSSVIALDADGATAHKPLTQEGTILGTFQYMAPEQLEGTEADARTDIFALGAVLYEMATGVRAFAGATKTSLIAAIVSQDPKPLAQIQPLTPPAFEHVVNRCLAKTPDDRWQSAHDVSEQLRWISEAGSQAGTSAPVSMKKRSRERLAWSLAAVLAIALAATAFLLSRVSATARQFVWDLTPPAGVQFNAVGDEAGAIVVSPDGTMAVFSGKNATGTQLWLRTLATGETKPIEGTDGAAYPFWSPDSRRIGFSTVTQLKRVDVAGGAPVNLCKVGGSRGGSWAPDGTIIFSVDTQSPLSRISASGGTATPLTKLEVGKHTSHRWPWFLPDGKHFLYLAVSHLDPTGGANGIYLGSLDGGTPKLILQATSNAVYVDGHVFILRDQSLFAQRMSESGELKGEPVVVADNVLNDGGIWRGAFSISDTGLLVYHTGRMTWMSTMRWMDRAGKELAQIGEPGSYWDVDLSPDGQKIAMAVGDPGREMWIHDVVRNTRTRLPIENASTGEAAFSPDGTRMFLDVVRGGRAEIIVRRVNGGAESSIYAGTLPVFVRGVSPDGKRVIGEDREGHLVTVAIDPIGAPQRLLQSRSFDCFAGYSPDGRWIAYQSDQNGRNEVFVISAADPLQKWQISTSGGTLPRWRRDGKEIFYVDGASKLTAVSLDATAGDLTIGTPQTLFPVVLRPQSRAYDVSPDGQKFLINSLNDQNSPNAVAVENWKSRLKR